MNEIKETILISGGMGFVGKNLIESLCDRYRIIVIDKNYDDFFIKQNKLSFYKFNFNNQRELNDIVNKENPDYVINLVSIVTAERDFNLFEKLYEINFKIFLSLYYAFSGRKIKLFINFGSAEEYGPIEVPFSETDREKPSSPYALIKQLTTNTALMCHSNYNFPVCVVRPANLFGRYQESNKIIPYIINQLSKDQVLNLSPGEQKRDYIHIDDFIYGIKIILENYNKMLGEIVNIGAGKSYSIKYIVSYLSKKLKSNSKINFGYYQYRENEMMDFFLDISFISRISSYNFKPDFLAGLDKILEEVIQ